MTDDARGASLDAASSLCRTCGVCCDGTMFGFVPLASDEAARLRHRLPVIGATATHEARFEQRCVALGPLGCSIYEDRPSACAAFRCKLLRRLEAGEISLDSAREVVSRVHELADDVARRLPPGKSFADRARHMLPRDGATSPEHGALWLDLKILDLLVHRELRNEDSSEPGEGEAATMSSPP